MNMEPVLTVKTSKKWTLPPRPKPGRKPSEASNEMDRTRSDNTQRGSCGEGGKTSPSAKRKYKTLNSLNSDNLSSLITDVNQENYNLKIDLINLIKNFKHLQSQIGQSEHKEKETYGQFSDEFSDQKIYNSYNGENEQRKTNLEEFDSDLDIDDELPSLTTTPTTTTTDDEFLNLSIINPTGSFLNNYSFKFENFDNYNYVNELIEQKLIENDMNYYIDD